MPLFDGFKMSSYIQKAKLELEKAKVERDKQISQYTIRLSTLRSNLAYLDKQIENNKNKITQLKDKENSNSRLLANKLISPIELNETKIRLLQEQIEYEKNNTASIGIIKGIQTLTTY